MPATPRYRWTLAPAAAALCALSVGAGTASAQSSASVKPGASAPAPAPLAGWAKDAPALSELVAFGREQSELRVALERYARDRGALLRRYDVEGSAQRRERLRRFYQEWRSQLAALDFASLNHEAKLDYVLLDHELVFQLATLDQDARQMAEIQPLVPFLARLQALQESRREHQEVDARKAAQTLDEVAAEVESLTRALAEPPAAAGRTRAPRPTPVVAYRAAGQVESIGKTLQSWYGFYSGYDPVFTWWAKAPYERLTRALQAYRGEIREKLVGIRPGKPDPVIGDPIGAEGMRAHLAREMIPYTPEELIAIAEREFAWCEKELLKASREMGYGDDWRAAQEAVKNSAVAPGQKPGVVLDLERQSEAFIAERGSITLPPLAREIWRMEMMSPEKQLVSPFFLGGEVIQVSYPTDAMAHADKLMSMRGNNPHFNRATVHHELIPGHHLQGFMTGRFNAHRSLFSTPFWGEGWALYWEMVLWDQGFPRTPEDRVGMLFWRMHRAARIIFSLSFHLERMAPQQAVDFLVERVGHERANAEAEVRRSFIGTYSPLYQAGYMLGALQFRALRQELVDSGRMTEREFHDLVLQGGEMPVEMVRARLLELPLSADYTTRWKFSGDVRAKR